MSTWMCKIAWFSLREFSEQLHAFVWFALPAHQCKRRFHMKPAFRSTILAIFIFCCDRVCSLVVSRKWIKHVTHRFRCSTLLHFYFLYICTWERYSECFTRRQGDVTWHKKKTRFAQLTNKTVQHTELRGQLNDLFIVCYQKLLFSPFFRNQQLALLFNISWKEHKLPVRKILCSVQHHIWSVTSDRKCSPKIDRNWSQMILPEREE